MQNIHISSHIFTLRIEPSMKSFSHANNIVLRQDRTSAPRNFWGQQDNYCTTPLPATVKDTLTTVKWEKNKIETRFQPI